MDFFNKIKNFFVQKDEIPLEKVNELVKPEEETTSEVQINDFDQSLERSELFDILNSAKLDLKSLVLDRIESEAETMRSYLQGLLKDLDNYKNDNKDKKLTEEAIRKIGGKIKHIASHGLELKNLLASLEDHYYLPVIEVLKKLNKKISKEEIEKLITKLEKDLETVKSLDSQITRVVGYNDLFNPEKNSKYKEEIEKEAEKRIIHGHLNELLDTLLIAVTDRTLGIKTRIEKNDPIEYAKRFI